MPPMSDSMEKRSSEGNVGQRESTDTAADQAANAQPQEESDPGDSANKSATAGNEPANERLSEEPVSSDSNNGPADTASGESSDKRPPEESLSGKSNKNPAAVSLGRLGGLKGGKARARTLTAVERSEAARKAATARWQKKTPTS